MSGSWEARKPLKLHSNVLRQMSGPELLLEKKLSTPLDCLKVKNKTSQNLKEANQVESFFLHSIVFKTISQLGTTSECYFQDPNIINNKGLAPDKLKCQ